MKIKEQIEKQKAFIQRLEEHQKNNGTLITPPDPDKGYSVVAMLKQILIYQKIDLEVKIKAATQKLKEMENYFATEYQISFEKVSRECNLNMEHSIKRANKVIMDLLAPQAIRQNIKDIITKWELEKDSIEQEDKNEIYHSLNNLIKLAVEK